MTIPIEKESVVAVIPARIGSTRLPRKVLRPILGKPLLGWVVGAALKCTHLDKVIVATDSEEVLALCVDSGWECMITDASLPSGTDRMRAVARTTPADIYVNIQGDEPTIQPEHIHALLGPFSLGPTVGVTTLKVSIDAEDARDPNIVKVVSGSDNHALYFSRAPIPFDRENAGTSYWKHLGLYAYRSDALQRFGSLPPTPLERTEKLEQLRLLENGIGLYVAETALDTVGVDTEEDLLRAEALLLSRLHSSPDQF